MKSSLLWLQDDRDVDIPFFLFTLWTGHQGIELTAEELARFLDLSSTFSDSLIGPVRQSRRWVKAHQRQSKELYQQLLDTELACEKFLMEELESLCRREFHSVGSADASRAGNTELYLKTAGIDCDAEARERLAKIFSRLD